MLDSISENVEHVDLTWRIWQRETLENDFKRFHLKSILHQLKIKLSFNNFAKKEITKST